MVLLLFSISITVLPLTDYTELPGLLNLAIAYFNDGKYEEAKKHLNDILSKSESTQAHELLGRICTKEEKPKEAVEHFVHVLNDRPDSVDAMLNLAVANYQNGEINSAKILLMKAITKAPESYEAYFNLGIIMMRSEELKEAKNYFEKALKHDPPQLKRQIIDRLISQLGDE